MAPIIEQSRPDSADLPEAVAASSLGVDVPGMMADRIGQLYAEEERLSRIARTERLIKEAESLT
jgi:hypothetical protein